MDGKKSTRIDMQTMLGILTYLKEIDLMDEKETEADEYCKS